MAGALPYMGAGGNEVESGQNVREMLATPAKGYLLWDLEPEFDLANPAMALQALDTAESVVAVSSFANETLKAHADVILPLAPVAESEGSYYSMDGQSFVTGPAVKPSGQSRAGWKILRRLGDELELEGFSQVDIASLHDEMNEATGKANATPETVDLAEPQSAGDLYRVGELAMYGVDALCRRSDYLQQTVHAETAFVGLNPKDAGSKGLVEGHEVKVSQGEAHVILPVCICNELPVGAVWVKSATESGTALGDSYGPISVEAA
jgi:NADH-quinone oxidoreductase subunit G